MIYGKSGITCLNPQRHISSATSLREPQTHTINTLWVQCKVLSVMLRRTQENLLALKGCTNEARVNISYRRSAWFFLHVTGYDVIILNTANCRNTYFVTSKFKNSSNWRWISVLKKNFQEKKFGNKIRSRCVTFIIFLAKPSGVPRNFVRGGVQQIQLRTEDRENGDLGAVAP